MQFTRFAMAMGAWLKAGRPRREPEWVAETFENTCLGCEAYRPKRRTPLGDKGICGDCGCHVSGSNMSLRNKLVLPTEKCPRGLW